MLVAEVITIWGMEAKWARSLGLDQRLCDTWVKLIGGSRHGNRHGSRHQSRKLK